MNNVKIVVLLVLTAILILALVIAVLLNNYLDLKKKYDKLHDNFNEQLTTIKNNLKDQWLGVGRKEKELKSDLFEAWSVLHLCNKQRRYYRKLVIMNAAEKEALNGNIAVIKKGKDKLVVIPNERLQYLLDTERRCQYLDAKIKLNETPETRDSFERANYEKYMEEFKANKKRLQEIVEDYTKHELEAKDEKR